MKQSPQIFWRRAIGRLTGLLLDAVVPLRPALRQRWVPSRLQVRLSDLLVFLAACVATIPVFVAHRMFAEDCSLAQACGAIVSDAEWLSIVMFASFAVMAIMGLAVRFSAEGFTSVNRHKPWPVRDALSARYRPLALGTVPFMMPFVQLGFMASMWVRSWSLVAGMGLLALTFGGIIFVGALSGRFLNRGLNGLDLDVLCRNCSYPLFAIAGQRCPECGEPFDAEQVKERVRTMAGGPANVS